MIAAATWPREKPEADRLLWIDPAQDAFVDARIGELPSLLRSGDLLVVNDAATLPASLRGLCENGAPFELRLLSHEGGESTRWRAVIFGRGDFRQRTEDRPPPPRLVEGARARVAGGATVRVLSVAPQSPRLLRIEFESDAASMWGAIYGNGRPVQYSYVQMPLALWHVQSSFTGRPWAVEPPSAGRPLTFAVLEKLRRRGVGIASVTHAAGLSSTGDPALDEMLPLDERYDLPFVTVRAIAETRSRAGRIVAVGTTVVRALEGCADTHDGALVAGEGRTALRLDGCSQLRVVSGLLTGVHERGTTHFDLMQTFAPQSLLDRAISHAAHAGYLQHEFGDSVLILAR
jgi:S-adenosylmethionine:tRNA ribosyltransferase-isomerase